MMREEFEQLTGTQFAPLTPGIQVRYPSEIYAALKERAYCERRSMNALVVEAVTKLLDEKSPGTRPGQERYSGGEKRK